MKRKPVLAAIDLGAESCRVSLLRWAGERPAITMVRRFANAPKQGPGGLCWDLPSICRELEAGLRACAELAQERIDAVGVTGWAVDYVRLGTDGRPLGLPFCYRDARTNAAMEQVHGIVAASDLYARTGVQIQPLNTVYQLYADKLSGADPAAPWVNLPEFILHWLGARPVAEFTNATHTGLVDAETRTWSEDIFAALGLDRKAAPELVSAGTALGRMSGELSRLPAFAETQLIAPACHDTASAVAGIAATGDGDWAYISSGTWSLVGMVLREGVRTAEACARGFTNLGAAGGGVLFHRGLPGMWLLRECLNEWESQRAWSVPELIAEAERLPTPHGLVDLDDPELAAPGKMPARLNAQRRRLGLPQLAEGCEAAPQFANWIFRSLATRYGRVLDEVSELTGRRLRRIRVVGGGSRNGYLSRLTERATGLPVERGAVESATLGNFAVQWARLEGGRDGVTAAAIAERAAKLAAAVDD